MLTCDVCMDLCDIRPFNLQLSSHYVTLTCYIYMYMYMYKVHVGVMPVQCQLPSIHAQVNMLTV